MTVELIVEPSNADWEPDDLQRSREIEDLRGALEREVDVLPARVVEVAGRKGASEVAEIVIALGQAGVFGAAVAIFNGWLKQGRRRSITFRYKEDGKEKSLTATSEGIDAKDLLAFAAKQAK